MSERTFGNERNRQARQPLTPPTEPAVVPVPHVARRSRGGMRVLLLPLAGVAACVASDAIGPDDSDFDWDAWYAENGECVPAEDRPLIIAGGGCAGGTGEVDTTVYCDRDYDGDRFAQNTTCADGETPEEDGCLLGGDCREGNPDIHPGAGEFCDGVDTDCDGNLDNGYPNCDPDGDDDDDITGSDDDDSVGDDDDVVGDDDDSGLGDDDDVVGDDDDDVADDDDATNPEGCTLLVAELPGGGEITWAAEIEDPDGVPLVGVVDDILPSDTAAEVFTENNTNPMWYVQATGPGGALEMNMTLTCDDPTVEVEVVHGLSGNGFVGEDFDAALALSDISNFGAFTPVAVLNGDGSTTTVTSGGDIPQPQEAFIVHTP